MHIDQVGDFLLGWFGFDFKNDDAKAARAVPKPEAKPEAKPKT